MVCSQINWMTALALKRKTVCGLFMGIDNRCPSYFKLRNVRIRHSARGGSRRCCFWAARERKIYWVSFVSHLNWTGRGSLESEKGV